MSPLWKRDLDREEGLEKYMIECPVCGYRFTPSFREEFPTKTEFAKFTRCPRCQSWIVMPPTTGNGE